MNMIRIRQVDKEEYITESSTVRPKMLMGEMFVLEIPGLHPSFNPLEEERRQFHAKKNEINEWRFGRGIRTHVNGWNVWYSMDRPTAITFKLTFV